MYVKTDNFPGYRMKKILLFFCLNWHFLTTSGQSNFFYRVNHYTTEDGLAHNSGNCFIQDRYGFVWIGSNLGLARFDGYEFTIYQIDETNPASISSSRVTALFIDKNNSLWVGTSGGGLNKYQRDGDLFNHYLAENDGGILSSNNISFIAPASNNRLWVGTHGGGINLFDPFGNTNKVFRANAEENNSLNSNDVNCYAYDDRGQLWVGGLQGINIIDTATNTTRDFYAKSGDLSKFQQLVIRSLSRDGQGNIWIGAWVNGVYKYNVAENTPVFVPGMPKNPEIHDIIPISDREMAVATNRGLFFIDTYTFEKVHLQHDPLNAFSLSHNTCTSLFKDGSGTLWIGTINSGINKIDLYQKKFDLYQRNVLSKNTLSHNFINGFEEGWGGNIWICTQKGLNEFNPTKGTFKTFHFLDKYNDDKVNTVVKGARPYLWVGTDYGLIKFNKNSGDYTRYEMGNDSKSLTNNVINDLHYDAVNQQLWIGTWGGGLDKLDIRKNEWENFPVDGKVFANNVVLTIAEDREGYLWLGTFGRGLMKFNPRNKQFIHVNTGNYVNNTVISLMIDEKGKIWAGTGTEGVLVVDPEENQFVNIDTEDGLRSNEIAGILESKPGEYWISSAKGLTEARIDLEKTAGQMAVEKLVLNHFDAKDGLQANSFNQSASLKTASGKLYFGGNEGFNAFFPDSIRLNPFLPIPVITSFELMGSNITQGKKYGERIILQKPVYRTDEISLTYKDNLIGFELSAMHFAAPEKNKFAYKLENFHDQWIYTDASRRFISFSYLKPGDYELKIRATNNDGIWSSNYSSLKIHVSPPWWNTATFILSASLLLIALIIGYIKYRTFKLRQRQLILEKVINDRTHEIIGQKNDIQTQNEELAAMNEMISSQSDQLIENQKKLEKTNKKLKDAQMKLRAINKNLDKTVRERTAELEKTVKELDHFVYVASHDLGAPLKSILGLVNITKLEHGETDLHQKLDMIESSIIKLENVIFSLKQFSRNTYKEIATSEINLADFIREIIDSMRFVNNFERITFNVDIPGDLVIHTDGARLKSIFTNLVDNAIKYHDYDKPNPFIAIQATKKWKACFVKISDNGLGIDSRLIDNIFNMFYRANTKSEGSGLGLYLVKESLTKLNGAIKVKSKLSRGTTFIIKLPVK